MTALPLECHSAHSTSAGPSRVCTSSPVSTFQMRTVPSYDPVRAKEPLKLKPTEVTVSVWPSNSIVEIILFSLSDDMFVLYVQM